MIHILYESLQENITGIVISYINRFRGITKVPLKRLFLIKSDSDDVIKGIKETISDLSLYPFRNTAYYFCRRKGTSMMIGEYELLCRTKN